MSYRKIADGLPTFNSDAVYHAPGGYEGGEMETSTPAPPPPDLPPLDRNPKSYIGCPQCKSFELMRCECQFPLNYKCKQCDWGHLTHYCESKNPQPSNHADINKSTMISGAIRN